MTREDIIKKCKARMDELSPFTSSELNPSIDLIDELLDEATTSVLMITPLYLIKAVVFPTTSLVQTGRTGHIDLPPEFLRLHSFKMNGWDTEVVEAISPQHPKYKFQKHAVTMGGTNKPVVVIKGEEVSKVLYYYSLPEGATHTVEISQYIKNLIADTDSATIPDDITDFIAWQCASDVFIAMEEVEASNAAKVKLMDIINIKTI